MDNQNPRERKYARKSTEQEFPRASSQTAASRQASQEETTRTDSEGEYGRILNEACNAYDNLCTAKARLKDALTKRQQAEEAVAAATQQLEEAKQKQHIAQKKLKDHAFLS